MMYHFSCNFRIYFNVNFHLSDLLTPCVFLIFASIVATYDWFRYFLLLFFFFNYFLLLNFLLLLFDFLFFNFCLTWRFNFLLLYFSILSSFLSFFYFFIKLLYRSLRMLLVMLFLIVIDNLKYLLNWYLQVVCCNLGGIPFYLQESFHSRNQSFWRGSQRMSWQIARFLRLTDRWWGKINQIFDNSFEIFINFLINF
jgi:hypothetical protein